MVVPTRFTRAVAAGPGVAGTAVILCGLLVLLGWSLNVTVLKSVLPGLVAMNPMTAAAFVAAGASLGLQRSPQPSRRRGMGLLLAGLILLIAGLTLVSNSMGCPMGIDRVLFASRLGANQMAPNTILNFILVSLGLLLLHARGRRTWLAQAFTLAAAGLSLLSAVGYLYGAEEFYRVSGFIPMAMNTAGTFCILCLGMLCARPDREPTAALVSPTLGGVMARRLLPAALFTPLMLGWLCIVGSRAGLYETSFGASLMAIGNLFILVLLVWLTAKSLHKVDIQRRRTEDALRQTEKLASLGQMVAGVAHEINNPLAFVSNNVAVLQRDVRAVFDLLGLYRQADGVIAAHEAELSTRIRVVNERCDLGDAERNTRELMERSRDGLRRIQQIVKDLRDFARLDEGDVHEANLNAGIQSTVNITQGLAHKKQVRIDLDLAALPLVTCHAAKINQVVMNLLTNAIDACPEGGTVVVRTSADEGEARIEVSDNGSGIDPDIAERIFDPFFTTKPPGYGTGLGLSISYGIIRDHGGSIEVQSSPGQGARFTVHLPRPSTPKRGKVKLPRRRPEMASSV